MLDHGLSNVMEVIKRQKWESLFKRRELVHTDVAKEFYAKSIMSHNRKKDVAKSKVRGVEIVFDYLQLASILGILDNGICEYIKEVWEESKYIKPLEITRRIANDESIMEARRVKSVEMKPFQSRQERMDYGGSEPEKIGEGMMMMKFRKKRTKRKKKSTEFDREAMIDEVVEQGESGSMINFSMLKWRSRAKDRDSKQLQAVPKTIHSSIEQTELRESTLVSHSVEFRKP
ncbi:hypothetical protein Dimus_008537 [Dionaea muscipula]